MCVCVFVCSNNMEMICFVTTIGSRDALLFTDRTYIRKLKWQNQVCLPNMLTNKQQSEKKQMKGCYVIILHDVMWSDLL